MKIEPNIKYISKAFSKEPTCTAKTSTKQSQSIIDTYYPFEKSQITGPGILACLRTEIKTFNQTDPQIQQPISYDNKQTGLKQTKKSAHELIQSQNKEALSSRIILKREEIYHLKEKSVQANIYHLHQPSAERINTLLN